jgi:diguanylate cyclase (GGDEF)-like protein
MPESSDQSTRAYTSRLVTALSHLHGVTDVAAALAGFVEEIRGLFQATGVLWLAHNRSDGTLRLDTFSGSFEGMKPGLVLAEWDSYFQSLLEAEAPQILEGEALKDQLPAEAGGHPDVVTALSVRIGSSSRPLGVLVALLPTGASLAVREMEALELLGFALERALSAHTLQEELHNQVSRFLLLHDLSRILQSVDPLEKRLQGLVANLQDSFGARFGYIMLYNERLGLLEFGAASGIELSDLESFEVKPGMGVTGRVFESGKAELIPDVSADPDYIKVMDDVVSELAIPIAVEGEVIGVLNFESKRADSFSEDDLRLASIISAQIGVTLRHTLSYESARTRLNELELLNRVTRAITTIDDLNELLPAIVEEIHDSFGTTIVGILLKDEGGAGLTVRAAAGEGEQDLNEIKLALGKGITGAAAQAGETVYVPDVTRDPRYIPVDPLIRSELAVPLRHDEQVIGILNLESKQLDGFSEEDRRVTEIVASQIAQILGKALLYDQMQTMAITDGLTELYNHREFFSRLESEFKRSIRYSYPLSLIMVDIDYFKEFNDAHGHLQGDLALRQVADLVVHAVRETDVVARYGGEEFTAILPLCHESTAEEVAERLRLTIEEAEIRGAEGGVPITVSVGICTAPQHASTYEQLLRHADDAMYSSKTEGRNRCTVWREGMARDTSP